MTKYEYKRRTYLDAVHRGMTKKLARDKAGLGPHAPARIAKLFHETGMLADRPRSGRPRSYTPGVFAAVQAELAAHSGRMYTAPTLVNHLKKKRILHQGANADSFLRVWHKHLHREGKKLTAASTSTRFYLTAEDQKDRVRFARAMLRCLRGGDISQCIFVDETTLEENPHPK
jgi:hypothetical protein